MVCIFVVIFWSGLVQRRYSRFWYELCYLIVVIELLLLVALAALSNFSYNLFYSPHLGDVFFEMWHRLIVGDVSISYSVIRTEAFFINGKITAYFLPFPALIRGFLSIFQIGQFPIPSILMAIILYSIAIYFLLKEVLNLVKCKECPTILMAWYPFFLLPVISLLVRASVYWEAIIWALALFMTQAFLFILFLRDAKISTKYLLLLVSSLVLFSRPTYAVASSVLVSILVINDYLKAKDYVLRSWLPYGLFVLALLLLALLNYARWGSPFEFAAMQYNEQLIGTERARLIALMPSLSLFRIPETLEYYFWIARDNFSLHFPFITADQPGALFKWLYFDYKELAYPITLGFPLHILGGILGVCALFRWIKTNEHLKRIFQMCFFISLIPAVLILMIPGMALRYRAELYASLIFTSMIGVSYLQKFSSKKKIIITAGVLTTLALALVINTLFVERLAYFSYDFNHTRAVCAWLPWKCNKPLLVGTLGKLRAKGISQSVFRDKSR